jgi:hypothetical protein
MRHRPTHHSKPKNVNQHESIPVNLQVQRATTQDEFQALIAEHDRLTDTDGEPRLTALALELFRRGPPNTTPKNQPDA